MFKSSVIPDSNTVETLMPAELLALLKRNQPPEAKPSKPGRPSATPPSY